MDSLNIFPVKAVIRALIF